MIDHETALLLAAREINEDLSPDEAAGLREHLAGCPTCRRSAVGLRRDDVSLRALLVEAPISPRVRQTVLGAARGRNQLGRGAILALAATLILGILALSLFVGGPGPGPTETASPSAPAPSPSISASPSPSGPSVNGAYNYSVAPDATRRDSVSARFEGGPVGEWSRMVPATGGGTSFGGPVTCLVIDGPDAWLAGPATTASDGSTDRAAFLFVHDGGPDGTEDTAVLWMNDPGQTLATMEGWCESRFIPAGPFPLEGGDVIVDDGTDPEPSPGPM